MTIDEIKARHDLGKTNSNWPQGWPIMYDMVGVLLEEIRILREECKRVREGNFTEREFQNLCHNLIDCDRKRFEEGCRQYQDRLFGPKGESC